MPWVLDASALLAYLDGEPGGDRVGPTLLGGFLSAVNAAEVVAKLIARGKTSEAAAEAIRSLPCRIVSVDAELGFDAGRIHAATRGSGISLGDAICLPLAQREGLPALTADRAWASLEIGVEVRLIR